MEKTQSQVMSPEEREKLRKELLAQVEGITYKGWIKPFLTAYAETGIIGLAAKAAKIERRTVTGMRARNQAFAILMDMAREQSIDVLEGVAKTRAIHGTRKLVLHHGKPVKDPRDESGKTYLYETKQSDALLIFLLKKYRYPDQVNHTHAGPGGGPIPVQHTLKQDQLVKRIHGQIKNAPQLTALPEGPVIEAETDDSKIVSGEDDEELQEVLADDGDE